MNETTVLVAGDALLVQVVRHLLDRADLVVVHAGSPDQALSAASAQPLRLAILDLDRPGGADLPVVLHSVNRTVPLLLVTDDPAAAPTYPPARVLQRGDDLDALKAALETTLAEPAGNGAEGKPARRPSWLGRVLALVLGLALLAGIAVLVLPLLGVPGLPNLLEPWLGKPEPGEEVAASVA